MNKYLVYCAVSATIINNIVASIENKISDGINPVISEELLSLDSDFLPKWIDLKNYTEGNKHIFDLIVNKAHKLKYIVWDGIKKEIPDIEISKYQIHIYDSNVLSATLTLINKKNEIIFIKNLNITKIPLWMRDNILFKKYNYKIPLYVDLVNLPKEITQINVDGIKLIKLSNIYSKHNFIKGCKWNDIWEYICPDGFEINDLTYEKVKSMVYLKIILKTINTNVVKRIEKQINLNEKISYRKIHKTYLRRYLGGADINTPKNPVNFALNTDELENYIDVVPFYNKILLRINPEVSDKYMIGSISWNHTIFTINNMYIHAVTIEPLEAKKLLLSVYYSQGGELFIARHLNVIDVTKLPKWIEKVNKELAKYLSDIESISIDLCKDILPDILLINKTIPNIIMLKINHEVNKVVKEINMDDTNISNIKINQPVDRMLVKQENGDIYINILTRIYNRWNYDFSNHIFKLSCKKKPNWLNFQEGAIGAQMTLDLTSDALDNNVTAIKFNNLLIIEAKPETGYFGMSTISWDSRWMYTTDNIPINIIILESIDGNMIEITMINLNFYGTIKYTHQAKLVKLPNWIGQLSQEFTREYREGVTLDISKDTLPPNIVSRSHETVVDLELKDINDTDFKINKIIWNGETSQIRKGKMAKATIKYNEKSSLDVQLEFIEGRNLKFEMFKSISKGKVPEWLKEINNDMAESLEGKVGIALNLCQDELTNEIDVNDNDKYHIEFAIKKDLDKNDGIIGVDWGTGANFVSYEDEIIEKVNINKKNREILITKSMTKNGVEYKKLEKGIMKCPEIPKWYKINEKTNEAIYQTLTIIITPLLLLLI